MAIAQLALTNEQRQALRAASDQGPVTIWDPATSQAYVLVRAELYDRCRALLGEDEFQPADAYPAMDDVARREGWLDPEMDAYDQLDPRRQQ
jgi:hypothetical protein